MTHLAHAAKSHLTPIEKEFFTATAHNTGAKRGSPMRKLAGSTTICCLLLGLLVLVAASCSHEQPPVTEQIAKAYGLNSYGNIDTVRYTFNLQFPGLNLSRTWTFEPRTGQVTYEGKDREGKPVKATYVRSQLSSQSDAIKNEIDPTFINDNYWFLLPFHVYWDNSANVQDKGLQPLPQGSGSAKLVSVKYPSDVGYTPGDTWDLYLVQDNRIEQMVYHRGGQMKPSLVIASWEGYKKAGPLLVSTEHHGTADGGPLHLFFSDVAVKLTDFDAWVKAK
jgi:hypothetical protein